MNSSNIIDRHNAVEQLTTNLFEFDLMTGYGLAVALLILISWGLSKWI